MKNPMKSNFSCSSIIPKCKAQLYLEYTYLLTLAPSGLGVIMEQAMSSNNGFKSGMYLLADTSSFWTWSHHGVSHVIQ